VSCGFVVTALDFAAFSGAFARWSAVDSAAWTIAFEAGNIELFGLVQP
jgi:hypothetical protein